MPVSGMVESVEAMVLTMLVLFSALLILRNWIIDDGGVEEGGGGCEGVS